jgi:hypothetical protein
LRDGGAAQHQCGSKDQLLHIHLLFVAPRSGAAAAATRRNNEEDGGKYPAAAGVTR